MDEVNEKNFSISELDLQEDAEYDLDNHTNSSDTGYNLRKSKDPETHMYKKHFDNMLSDLSVSDFQLVVDTVEGLRDLISSFSSNNLKSNDEIEEITPLCEVTLVTKLTELLNFLEPTEAALKDTIRKARAKLQREWSNFKEGARIHCQFLEMQRYKRYRNLPYPHLAPKTASNSDNQSKAKTRSRIPPSKVVTRVGKRMATNRGKETVRNNRMSRHHQQEETKLRKEEKKNTSNTEKTRIHRTTKTQNNRRDEYYERAEFPRTQNNYIQTTRVTRMSWRNGPMLRQSMRLPAHRTIHPLLTLLRKSDTLMATQKRRTQTKIGFYRALAKGKINVRLPIED